MRSTRRRNPFACTRHRQNRARYRWISEDSRRGIVAQHGWSGVHRFDPASGKFTVYRHSDAPGTLSSDAANASLRRSIGNRLGRHAGWSEPAGPGDRGGDASTTRDNPSSRSTRFWRTRAAISGSARKTAWSGSIRARRRSGITTRPMGSPLMSLAFPRRGRVRREKCTSDRTADLTVFDPARIVEDVLRAARASDRYSDPR